MRRISCIAMTAAALMTTQALTAQDRSRVPQGPSGTVTLPLTEYNQLIDRAGRPEKRLEHPPIAAVVSRADLRARVSADMARGTLKLDGEVFRTGATKVALVTGATLVDARTDGRPLPLLNESDTHAAVLPGPAPFSVTLEWTTPLTSAPGRATFALPVPAGGSVSATLDLPGDPADVRVEPGLVTHRQLSGGRTIVEVTLEPGHRAQVSWSVRETTATPAARVESRTLADLKTLVTIGEADLRMISLMDMTVLQGDPQTFEVRVPRGFEVTAVSGGTLETSEVRGDTVLLTVRDPGERRHQFLLSLEQAHAPGSFKIETSFPTIPAAQRETGEVAVEGIGTMELTATGDDTVMRRMDVRETNPALQSLARQSLMAAFRYQRHGDETRVLSLDVKRFADAAVLAAIAERATVTTLVTSEGRTLTEVELLVRNRAQPFMKVSLPQGATIVSVEVAGESAKPVQGADGTRVPLLRPGFRPADAYRVSFVYQHAGNAFAKSGDMQMVLPTIDLPVSILRWELFLPERYKVKPVGGNAIPAVMRAGYGLETGVPGGVVGGVVGGVPEAPPPSPAVAMGQIVGRVTDSSGASLPGATITAVGVNGTPRTSVTDEAGYFVIGGLPNGHVTVTSELPGFAPARREFTFDQRPRHVDLRMEVGSLAETVSVTAEAPLVNTRSSERSTTMRPGMPEAEPRESKPKAEDETQTAPSQNVLNLQRRVAGVLPVRIDVPRSGSSYRFVRPLVLGDETTVTFRYKKR